MVDEYSTDPSPFPSSAQCHQEPRKESVKMKNETQQRISERVEENTTDATPSPPRQQQKGQESVNIKIEKEKPEAKANPKCKESQENRRPEVNEESNWGGPPNEFTFNSEFNSVPNYSKPTVVNNVMQVIGSTKTHIGNIINYTYTPRKSYSKYKEKQMYKETEEIAKLKSSLEPVKEEDINEFSMHVGKGWQKTFRILGFTTAYIEQQQQRFHADVPELIHWLFVDWMQDKGSAATVGVLAHALLKAKQYDALTVWAEKYDQIHQ